MKPIPFCAWRGTPRCSERVKGGGYCPSHAKERVQQHTRFQRGGGLYGRKWDRERLAFLDENFLCVECKRPAEEVDHIVPHRGNREIFWNRSNWQVLCKSCHSSKTAKETWGLG